MSIHITYGPEYIDSIMCVLQTSCTATASAAAARLSCYLGYMVTMVLVTWLSGTF